MTKVTFYEAQVNYRGHKFDSSDTDFIDMVTARALMQEDRAVETIAVEDTEARRLDGRFEIIDRYPSNRICVVKWSYIDDWEDEDEV